MNVPCKTWAGLCSLALLASLGCHEVVLDQTENASALDPEYGKPLMEATPGAGKDDGPGGIRGPLEVFGGSDTEVWAVTNQWHDTDTPDALEAGMAWEAESGLDWDEKYERWVSSMDILPAEPGETFSLTTPWGFALPAPVLECAELAVFLRVTFASWHHLPFFISAWSNGSSLHFGHFGVVREDTAESQFPRYRTRYADYEALPLEEILAEWPSDPVLAERFLTTKRDDENTFLGEARYSGAYFDQIFLNKRVGYFLMTALTFTGSIHLASTDNTYNVKARSVRAGDVLLKRWQRTGIGHTMVVMRVTPLSEEAAEVEISSGSMPRRQPRWQDPASSKYSFVDPRAGGEGESLDGHPYATLGGGLKRWRTASTVDGRWRNQVPDRDADSFIPSYKTEAIAERTVIFKEFLGQQTPEEMRTTLLALIESKRLHLETYPASCSARNAREGAFAELYALAPSLRVSSGAPGSPRVVMTAADIDRQYRSLADYVFAPLEYSESRTCCWNSSTAAMYEIIMDYAETVVHDEAAEQCHAPPVFKMEDGDYEVFAQHADTLGRSEEWVAWSADESCPQEHTVHTDTETAAPWSADWCAIQ